MHKYAGKYFVEDYGKNSMRYAIQKWFYKRYLFSEMHI